MINNGSVGKATLSFPNSTSFGLIDKGVKNAILVHIVSGFKININIKPITAGRINK